MPLKSQILAAALALMLLAGCGGRPYELAVMEANEPSSEPVKLDPDEVQREAPVLYDLLEEAIRTGYASTTDDEEREAVDQYLGQKDGYYGFVEYRGKFFRIVLLS